MTGLGAGGGWLPPPPDDGEREGSELSGSLDIAATAAADVTDDTADKGSLV